MGSARVLTGAHYLQGNEAMVEGALSAGCTLFAGYPITPSNEVSERMSWRLPQVGGVFVQGEDEMASIAMVVGASWGGWKAMTASSGPGFSLMGEGISYACMTETPCVIADVQRCGPGQGVSTKAQQGDMMQARWGCHGDHELIALAPSSVQEMFDLTVEAFNLSEAYRVPCLVMAEEIVAHMRDRVVIPRADEIKVVNRRKPDTPPGRPIDLHLGPSDTYIPPMPAFGEGYGMSISSFSRDHRGYPITDRDLHARLLTRLTNKIRKNVDNIARIETRFAEDADTVVVSYGTPARSALSAVRMARERGINAGYARLITIWPFADRRISAIAESAKTIIVAEMNMGQVFYEVQRVAGGGARVVLHSKPGVEAHTPKEIYDLIRSVA